MALQNLIIRTDASTQIGTGHVMRCLALSQAWQERGGEVIFVLANKSSVLENRLLLEGMQVVYLSVETGSPEDAKQTVDFARRFNAEWAVVDGYQFGAEYQKIIKNSGLNLLFIDDYGHADHYYADLVLNQNISANIDLYPSREIYTKLLLGTQYILLRREFWQWRGWQRETKAIARKLLVTFGGSDPDNVTLKVIQALQQVNIDDLEVIVVVGASNPHHEILQKEIADSNLIISLKQNVHNMPELMAWADIAIAAGGSTSWELAFMGLPSLVISLADNQIAIAEHLGKYGLVTNLGWYEDISTEQIAAEIVQLSQMPSIRLKKSKIGKELVDGKGCERAIVEIQGATLKLRKVHKGDRQLLWEWVNEPQVRAVSFSSELIGWEDHVQWFVSKLRDPNSQIYIATDVNDFPIGQVRFDIFDNEAIISISIAQPFRHQGYGHKIIQLAVAQIHQDEGIKIVHAYIKSNNQSSIGAFRKAGFKYKQDIITQENSAIQLSLDIENNQ